MMGIFAIFQPFQRFVQVGRVAVLTDGPDAGKIAAIVDVIDQNRVLLDGPCTGVTRQPYRIKNLHLTKLTANFNHSAGTTIVKKAWEEAEISKKFAGTSWGKRIEMGKVRKSLTDFDRFKLSKLKSQRRRLVNQQVNKLAKKK